MLTVSSEYAKIPTQSYELNSTNASAYIITEGFCEGKLVERRAQNATG